MKALYVLTALAIIAPMIWVLTQTSFLDGIVDRLTGRSSDPKRVKDLVKRTATESAREARKWERVRREMDESAIELKKAVDAWQAPPADKEPKPPTKKRAPRKPKSI